jgi:hypothetical protein
MLEGVSRLCGQRCGKNYFTVPWARQSLESARFEEKVITAIEARY